MLDAWPDARKRIIVAMHVKREIGTGTAMIVRESVSWCAH